MIRSVAMSTVIALTSAISMHLIGENTRGFTPVVPVRAATLYIGAKWVMHSASEVRMAIFAPDVRDDEVWCW